MKTRLIIATAVAVGSCVMPLDSHALIEGQTQIRQYDDSRTKVTSPAVDVSGTFNRDTMKVTFGWAQDVLTSASADVETFSSKGVIDDKRDEYSVGFETQIPDGTISVGYIQSDEDDYHSKAVSAGGTREFFQKNTVVGFGFANGNDKINSMSDPTYDEKMQNQLYSLSVSQVLSKVSILQFLYDFRVENGSIQSPYRRAKVIDNTGNITGQSENHPRTRNRNAFAVKYNYFFQDWKTTSATTYRLYQDSWGVLSHTLDQRFTKEFGRKWGASFSVRYYMQNKAKFYEDYYSKESLPPFFTGNNTLATYDSYMASVRPTYQINDNLGIFTKFEYYVQNFKDATDAHKLNNLNDDEKLKLSAFVIGLGLTAKF